MKVHKIHTKVVGLWCLFLLDVALRTEKKGNIIDWLVVIIKGYYPPHSASFTTWHKKTHCVYIYELILQVI